MSFHRRIRTIYAKELVDILRDRRTLIAMIVVPIVLYPLLMLGSVQAVSYQADSLGEEVLDIGVASDRHKKVIEFLIEQDTAALKREREQVDPDSQKAAELPTGLGNVRIKVFDSPEAMAAAIRAREIQAGIVAPNRLSFSVVHTNPIIILADFEEMRSNYVAMALRELFNRAEERKVKQRLRREGLPDRFVNPFEVTMEDLSSPPSILGQILPLILILMTITGAIYPAIDLTAGERERGTLESLMVSPVPVIDLIVGKFLVVTTVAIMGATLNLASVTATVYYGGFDRIIASSGGAVPIGKMIVILLCLVPFAVLMSAVMIAVCSYARTFKEAQNYVTPVILAVLIPGGIAALPATRLEGIMLVMPVGNMVLLARDLLVGAVIPLWQIVIVLLSTMLYAGAAVAVAANVFGKESVIFADAGSLKASLSRRFIKPSDKPPISMSLLLVALLFPTWLFVQSALSSESADGVKDLLYGSGWMMALLFVIVPAVVMLYWKVDIANTLALRMPTGRFLLAGVLIGLTAWIPAHEVNVFQQAILGAPQAVIKSAEQLGASLATMPAGAVFLLIALVPGVCEELLFRGFLLSGLRRSAGKWTALIVSAAIFAVFHFFLFKFAVTASLGIVLGYLCWQSRSILPAILAHILHNAVGALTVVWPVWQDWLGISTDAEWSHLPLKVVLAGGALFLVGLLLTTRPAVPTVDR